MLTKLNLIPDSSSYSVTDGQEVIRIELDGGAGRYRQDVLNATSVVNVSWSIGPEKYRYLRAFYKQVANGGSEPFAIDLIMDDSALTEHKAYFIPGSMQLRRQEGMLYVVSARLEVYPLTGTEDDDLIFALLYSEFGEGWESIFATFESDFNTVINTNLPSYL